MDFYPVTVCDIHQETADVTSITVKPSAKHAQLFQFTPGQFLIFQLVQDGQEVRRAYSICSSRSDSGLRLAVKHIEKGVFSHFVRESLAIGDTLMAHPPDGRFVGDDLDVSTGEYLGIAAGSGITPILAVIKEVLESGTDSRFTLFYGSRSVPSIVFRSELAGLKNAYMGRLHIYHVLSREDGDIELFSGRIDKDRLYRLLKAFCPQPIDRAFICGPDEMMMEARATLLQRGMDEQAIRIESFGDFTPRTSDHLEVSSDQCSVKMRVGGRTSKFMMNLSELTLLEAGLKDGVDLAYACKGGVCATCRCRVISGSASMDKNYALSKSELESGLILSCRARPTSKDIDLDFDI